MLFVGQVYHQSRKSAFYGEYIQPIYLKGIKTNVKLGVLFYTEIAAPMKKAAKWLLLLAGAEGLEPSTTVLETGMLPLHYAPIQFIWWAFRDSNPKPTGYEPVALTN